MGSSKHAPNDKKQAQNGDLEQARTMDIPTGKITSFYDPKRDRWRLLRHNNWTSMIETFYDPETRAMMEFETEEQAWQWFGEEN
jgi:hypothetical protein